jgi:hypothetical protein
LNASTESGNIGCYKMPRTLAGGVVTAEDIVLIVLLAFAIVAPPAFLWLGVTLERRKTRRQ